MKLQLYYPLDEVHVNQLFAENATTVYKDVLKLAGHNGIDFRAADGTPVYATHDGEVTFAGEDGSGGLGVVIRTFDAFDYEDTQFHFKTISWHLKKGSILVTPNQKVKAGQKIAEADNTGLSTGSHLHFGLKPIYQGEQAWQWWNAEQDNGFAGAINPMGYFIGKYPKDATVEPSVPSQTPYLALMGAAKAFQLSEGILDFQYETDLTKIRIGKKTLAAIKKHQ